ncbi:NUDIX domain-containing protein [Clostridiisalibacter paucivorans]|uniref:NUDIX domain-containing protein n=1 Tax=Clostridiisalibacter paucivorans TaxID=408753 RepID=UPI00047BFC32|nr:NUDIX domain-containing protein [Clostridiisalibacter paucivorans]
MQQIKDICPGIAVIIFNDKKDILLQKRADVGFWGIPSGHVEIGETITNAAIREVFEETGLHIEILRLVGVYSDPKSQVFKYPDGRITHFITCCFEAKIVGGKISCDSPETLEVKFFPIDALPSNIIKMHPNWLKDALSNNGPHIR